MRIGVGSTNPAKLSAVESILTQLTPCYFLEKPEIQSVQTKLSVPAQPRSEEEAIQGCQERAEQALRACQYGVGIEAFVKETSHGMFSAEYCMIIRKDGMTGIGQSGGFLIPPVIAEQIRTGEEMSTAVDDFFKVHNLSKNQGLIGILSLAKTNRIQKTEVAILYAFIPFLSSTFYKI